MPFPVDPDLRAGKRQRGDGRGREHGASSSRQLQRSVAGDVGESRAWAARRPGAQAALKRWRASVGGLSSRTAAGAQPDGAGRNPTGASKRPAATGGYWWLLVATGGYWWL